MSWRAVVAALDTGELLKSRVSLYRHPLAGRPILWHVVRALLDVHPAPAEVRVLHHSTALLSPEPEWADVTLTSVAAGDDLRALRAAVTPPGMTVLVDGAAPLIAPSTIARLLRAADGGVAALLDGANRPERVAVAGEGPALASADDPRAPHGAACVAPTAAVELL